MTKIYKWLLGITTAGIASFPSNIPAGCTGYCGRCGTNCTFAPLAIAWLLVAFLLGKSKKVSGVN